MTKAEEYSFNIESSLFQQLNKEQQELWRKEIEQAYSAGAEWQENQLEKNRLAACDRQSEKDAQRESDFVISLIEREHRQPTFDDAIKYGYHQAIADTCQWLEDHIDKGLTIYHAQTWLKRDEFIKKLKKAMEE